MKPGRWRALATAMLLVGSLFPALAARPVAAAVTDVDGANVFQLDGNVAVDSGTPGTDWAGLFNPTTLNPIPDGPAWVSSKFNQDWQEPDHSYFVPAKDGDPMSQWACQDAPGNLTPKDNIQNAYVTAFNGVDGNGTPHQLLYLGLERKPDSTGDAMAGFWFFQGTGVGCTHAPGGNGSFTGQKTQGDLLVLANFTNGGGTVDVQVYHWQSSDSSLVLDKDSSVDCASASGPVNICGISNTASFTPPWPDSPSGTSVPLTTEDFFEIGLDLSAIYGSNAVCSNTFMAETRSSQSLSATLKDYTMGAANICRQTTTTTVQSKTSGKVGDTVYDTATVGGNPGPTANAAGTVTFKVYAGQNCTSPISGATWTENAAWDNGQLKASTQSTPWTLPGVGTYYFVATYNGWGANESSRSGCNDEPVSVKADTTTQTHPSATSITLGQSLTDEADVTGVTGGGTPSGNVTFYVCGNAATDCQTGGTQVGAAKALSGTGITASATSEAYTPSQAGSYCFRAEYAGAGSYNGSKDGGSGECFTVGKAGSTTVTTPSTSAAQFGTSVTDSAKVTGVAGGVAPTGTVTFYICGPFATAVKDCGTATPTPVGTDPVNLSTGTVSGTAPAAISVTVTSAGVAPITSQAIYCFKAVYSGDANYDGSHDSSDTECFGVGIAPSTTVTTALAENGSATLGGRIQDRAVVSGNDGAPITGTVTFTVCGPVSGGTCPNSQSLASGTLANTTTGTPPPYQSTAYSGWFTPSSVGTYCFTGTYVGDTHYSTSSDTYTKNSAECITVGKGPSDTYTHPTSNTITLGQTNTDEVTVSGPAGADTPTGTVSFHVCGPLASAAGCATGGTTVGASKTLSNGSATSDPYTPGATGTYCFRADYGGDSNYNPSADGRSNECFTVGPADSTTVTTPGVPSIALTATNTDGVVVTGVAGGPAPTGNVTFYICGPLSSSTGCATGTSFDTESLTAGSTDSQGRPTAHATSTAYKPNDVGTWCFRAVYAGDGNYNGSHDGGVNECFSVGKTTSSTVTTPSDSSITLGQSLSDRATVSGADGVPSGTVDFFVCGPGAGSCASGGTELGTGTLGHGTTSGTSSAWTDSPSYTPVQAGSYCFRAEYLGDTRYGISSDGSSGECFTVGKAPSATATTPTASSIELGGSNTDDVLVTGQPGAVAPTGQVTFYVCGPLTGADGCASGGTQVGTAKPIGQDGKATSDTFTPARTGTYCFRGDYAGDGNYTGSSDGSKSECFTVEKGPSTTVTTPNAGSIQLGQANTDRVTVSGPPGAVTPTGSVSFFVCGPLTSADGCATGGTKVGADKSLVSGSATSDPYTASAAGTYCFRGEYGGDTNYLGSSDASSTECFSVGKSTSTTKTTPASTSIPTGSTNTDKVTVTGNAGGPTPTGTVNFYVCGPLSSAAGCPPATAAARVATAEVPSATLGSDGTATSPAFGPFNTGGWYCFRGEYLGDSNYGPSMDYSSAECFQVYVPYTPPNPSPTLATTPNPKTGVIGTALADTATLTGGNGNPTGTISFYLYGPGDTTCGTDLVAQVAGFKGMTVSAGKAATTGSYTATKLGTYQWVAQYSGDGANSGARGNCGDTTEQVVIGAAPSHITTAPNPGPGTPVNVGTAIKDVANVAGNSPTGTVDFHLYGPGDTSCTTNLLSGKTGFTNIPLSGGSATSPTYTTDKVGVYQWVATYSGDAANQPSSGACGDTTEQVTTGAVLAQIVTGANDLALAVLGLPFLAAGLSLLLLVARRREQNG